MKYKNLTNLVEWIEKTLWKPHGSYDLEAVLEDVESQYNTSGTPRYELSGRETITGNPETYSYEVEIDHDEESDTYTVTAIF